MGLAIDGHSSVYIEGWSFHPLYGSSGVTIKYDSAGNSLWANSHSNSGPANVISPIAVDSIGSEIYAATSDSVIKVDSLGNSIWSRNFSGVVYGIALDINSNPYVTGAAGCGYITRKFDVDGNLLWSTDLLCSFDGPSAFAIDKKGNTFVTGSVWVSYEVPSWVTVSYDSLGQRRWFQTFGVYPPGGGTAIALDYNGCVYAGGYLLNSPFSIVKYDSAGNLIWLRSGTNSGGLKALSSDENGNVFATGYSAGNGTGDDFFTIKYSPIPFLKGDLDENGVLTLDDIVSLLNCVFLGSGNCPPAFADVNCDAFLTPADVVVLLLTFFASAPPPC